jgi:hypothetical protein
VRQDCEAQAIFETILETVEASEWEPAFKAILKTIKSSRHEARIDDQAPKSWRKSGIEAAVHPVGHSVARTTAGMLGVNLAGTSQRYGESERPRHEPQASKHKKPPL